MNGALSGLLATAMPEIALGTGICVLLLAGLFAGRAARDVTYLVAMATLVVTAWLAAGGAGTAVATAHGSALVADPLAQLLKLFALAVTALVFAYSRPFLRDRGLDAGDFYVLGLFALLGILVMVSAGSFLVMYLGLETLALALYAMVAVERDAPVGAEAAMKYFVLGAIASGCLLYGISIVYGVTGTIVLADVASVLRATEAGSQVGVLVGLGFIVVGIAFKFGAVPFHTWLPDVYQGAPTCSTLFIATAPKIAAFGLALRVLVDGMGPLTNEWQAMLTVLAVLSLALGNLVAIAQTNLKRMLGYSTIAHVGFILLGFLAGSDEGLKSALFYTLVYVIMTAGAFGVVLFMSAGGRDAGELDDLKGLNQRHPWFAAMMLLIMVSMVGVPPLAGFYAKWWVLAALVDAGQVWLAIVGVVFSVIGAFYYLRVIRLMYFDESPAQAALQPGLDLRLLLSLNGLLVLALGLFPGRLMDLCARVLA